MDSFLRDYQTVKFNPINLADLRTLTPFIIKPLSFLGSNNVQKQLPVVENYIFDTNRSKLFPTFSHPIALNMYANRHFTTCEVFPSRTRAVRKSRIHKLHVVPLSISQTSSEQHHFGQSGLKPIKNVHPPAILRLGLNTFWSLTQCHWRSRPGNGTEPFSKIKNVEAHFRPHFQNHQTV